MNIAGILLTTGVLGGTLFIPKDTALGATNLIYNPGVEIVSPSSATTPAGWGRGKAVGTLTTNFAYPVTAANGTKAARVTISSYTSGDAKWIWTPVTVIPGRMYQYSDQYVATAPTSLVVEYTLTNGSHSYVTLKSVPTSSTWTSTSHTFTVPSNVTKARVFHLIKQTGTLTIDNVSLVDVTPSNNLIQNPSFESMESNGTPTGWIKGRFGTNTTTFTFPVTGRTGNGATVSMSAYTSGDAKWAFDKVAVSPGQFYQFSDYSKSNVNTFVTAAFTLSNGSTSFIDLGSVPPSSSWTLFKKSFTAPVGAVSLTIYHVINRVGTLSVDDYSLIQTTDSTKLDKGYVSLNFDDGYRDTYQNGIPILNAAGFKTDQYIVTNYVKGEFPGYVTKAMLLDMQSHGHVIGAHTRSHPDLTALSAAEAESEIQGSRDDLIAMGGAPVATFAYPFGAYNDSIKQMVRNAGFTGGRSSDGGQNDTTTDKYALRRYPMTNTTTFAQVKAQIDSAVTNKTWLILLFHEVSTNGAAYAVTPALLQQIVDYLKAQNITPITTTEGLQKMQQ